MTTHRGLFSPADLPEDHRPEERLQPGQPGKAWRRDGPWWIVDCKDGTRARTGNGSTRVTFTERRKG